MVTPEIVIDRVGAIAEAAEPFQMDEDAFRAFYDGTARAIWAYLSRITGSPALADDLLQEAYYRLLRARMVFDSDAHRRNYLFKIATNLAHDRRRRSASEARALEAGRAEAALPRAGGVTLEQSGDVRRAMDRLKPRERALLWLAYVEGSSHEEIAAVLGMRARSVRVLLHRARGRLRQMLAFDKAVGRRQAR